MLKTEGKMQGEEGLGWGWETGVFLLGEALDFWIGGIFKSIN